MPDEVIIYLERKLLRALKRPYPTGHPMYTDRSEQLLIPVLFGLAPRRDWSSHPCTQKMPKHFEWYRARLCPLIPGLWPGMVGFFIEKPRPILVFRRAAVSRYAALCSPDFPPVRPFGTCTSGGLTNFARGRLSPKLRPLKLQP